MYGTAYWTNLTNSQHLITNSVLIMWVHSSVWHVVGINNLSVVTVNGPHSTDNGRRNAALQSTGYIVHQITHQIFRMNSCGFFSLARNCFEKLQGLRVYSTRPVDSKMIGKKPSLFLVALSKYFLFFALKAVSAACPFLFARCLVILFSRLSAN